jgi:hypothetical protein
MTIDPRRRARQLAKKAAKRKAQLAKKKGPGSVPKGLIGGWPIHESYMSSNLFETGIGDVLVSRRMGDQVAVGMFLLDTGCLGVKDAFLTVSSPCDYQSLVDRFRGGGHLVPVEPEYARKLVEDAAQYAAKLGFEPHKDYRKAKVIFGAIDTRLCNTRFQFGKDGKPFYCSGPSDSPARRQQILDILTKRCGPGGFHYIVGIGDSGFHELDDGRSDDSDE